jgi:hypothetical protein
MAQVCSCLAITTFAGHVADDFEFTQAKVKNKIISTDLHSVNTTLRFRAWLRIICNEKKAPGYANGLYTRFVPTGQ